MGFLRQAFLEDGGNKFWMVIISVDIPWGVYVVDRLQPPNDKRIFFSVKIRGQAKYAWTTRSSFHCSFFGTITSFAFSFVY